MNWTRVGETEVALGDRFYVGLVATSLTNQDLSLARFKDVDFHPWGEPMHEGIVSHNFPDVIPASGVIDFEIEYEVDPVRQGIADSWPRALDDSAARAEWDWNPQWTLESMTRDMLEHLGARRSATSEE